MIYNTEILSRLVMHENSCRTFGVVSYERQTISFGENVPGGFAQVNIRRRNSHYLQHRERETLRYTAAAVTEVTRGHV